MVTNTYNQIWQVLAIISGKGETSGGQVAIYGSESAHSNQYMTIYTVYGNRARVKVIELGLEL